MDFFRFDSNGPTNDGSPVAQAIERATDPMLLTTDWGKNLEICDMINTGGQAAVTSATRMLRRQLRSDQPKTVMLALELTDTCVKNCAFELHRAVASKAFMGDVVALAEGKKGFEPQELSLKLIQEWGKEFKATRSELPGFFDTYVGLKTKGAAFPESESSAPVFSPPPQITAEEPPQTGHASASALAAASSGPGPSALPGASPAHPAPSPTGGSGEASMDKLRQDLVAVEEKIKLCREMLPESPGIEHDEALSEVVGFLEACQPRLSDLIEAGMQDILSEDILSHTLHVFDELQKTLEAERTGTPIPPTSPAPAPASASPEDVVAAAASGAAAASAALDLMGAEDEEPSLRTGRRKGRKAAGAAAAAAPTSSSPAGPSLVPDLQEGLPPPVQPVSASDGGPPSSGSRDPPEAAGGTIAVHADLIDLALPAMPAPQDPGPPPSYSAATVPPPALEPSAALSLGTPPAPGSSSIGEGQIFSVVPTMQDPAASVAPQGGPPLDAGHILAVLPPAQTAPAPSSNASNPFDVELMAAASKSVLPPAPTVHEGDVLSVLHPPGGQPGVPSNPLQAIVAPTDPPGSQSLASVSVEVAGVSDPEFDMYQAPSAEVILAQSSTNPPGAGGGAPRAPGM